MSNNIDRNLQTLGLSLDEQKLYIDLLRSGPQSMLQIARSTGINRTKTYRLVDDLDDKGLVTQIKDDQGSRVKANDPSSLEISVVNIEQESQRRRESYKDVLPALEELRGLDAAGKKFVVRTYDGLNGFKQMLWNELKTEGEALIYGSGEIEKLIDSERWAEKHRARTVEAGYTIREIINPGEKRPDFTKVEAFHDSFTKRVIDPAVLPLRHCIVIYNNTVATYCWRDGQKVGYEVINKSYAAMQRAMFEQFWNIATY